jgi:predicted flap endonuclease-1-like 5' DNA nuclease
MNFFLEDPILFWLVWGIFTLAGTIIGWSLRANTSEKEVRSALGRIEQEKNTLARLYTQIKHQHDLREADFRRASLDVEKLRAIVQLLEDERATILPDAPFNAARIANAEASAAQYAQKVAALEVLANSLRTRNGELSEQLASAQKDMEDWDTLYRGFKATQERLATFEQKSLALELERDSLREQLSKAALEIEALQIELQQRAESQIQKSKVSRKGGVAAPQVDDLKSIKGMAAFVDLLHGMGISTFAQISRWDDDTVIAVAKTLDISPGKIYRDDWVGQAQRLAGERR